MKQLLILLSVAISGCNVLNHTMSAMDIRTALDQCQEQELDVLAFQRPDHSVIDIRCIPKASQVKKMVTLRPKVPVQILKPIIYEQAEIKN